MSRFTLSVAAISTLCVLAALLWQPTPRLALTPIPVLSTSSPAPPPPVDFQEVTLDWGLAVKHTQSSEYLTALTETLGAGICVLDLNRDGWMDLLFVGGSGHSQHYGRKSWWNEVAGNRLLLNRDGLRFEDVTERAGLGKRIWGMGCAVADLDNDSHDDLVITGIGSTTLYRNRGDGTFEDVTVAAGLNSERWSTGVSIADFNRDGLLDIYVSNYIRYQKNARTFEQTSGFETNHHAAFHAKLYDAEPNQLFLNKGKLQFEDVAEQMTVSDSLGRGLGARWVDLNHDGWPDLVVINDHNSPNQVFINQQGQTFVRGGPEYAAFEVAGAHDLLIGDFDNRGQNDFFMSRSMSHPPVFLRRNPATASEHDSLFGDEAWERRLAQASTLPFTGWGAAAGDFNHDGLLDVYVANGMIMPDIDSHYVAQAQRNFLFINQGGGQFDLLDRTPMRQSPHSSRAVVAVDLNNDGYLELLVSNNNDPLQLFENRARTSQHWLGLDFAPGPASAAGAGTVVEITTDTQSVQRTLNMNQGFLAQGDPRLHVGLGDSPSIRQLVVRWPDGQLDRFENLAPDRYYRIDKAGRTLHPIEKAVPARVGHANWLSTLDEEALVAYSTVLLQAPRGSVRDRLQDLWDHGPDAVRRHLLEHVDGHWSTDFLPWVRDALLRDDVTLRLRAVDILKRAELEPSVAWLLPLLEDPDPRLQCATAEAFRFFFDEEEAVIQRKKLALAPLIELLSSTDDGVRICAADALAAAENKRAIQPLLALASADVATRVRASAIRALGLVRDTSARPTLVSLAESRSTDADLVAAALIALNRMNEPTLGRLVEGWFGAADASVPVSMVLKRLQMLIFLFEHPDGNVLSKRQPELWLTELIRNDRAGVGATEAETTARVLASLRAIEVGRVASLMDFADAQVHHENPHIVLQALVTLSSLSTVQARERLEHHLRSAPISLVLEVIRRSQNQAFSFSNDFIAHLAARVHEESGRFDALVPLLDRLPGAGPHRLFNALLDQNLTHEQLQFLFDWCAVARVPVTIGKPHAGVGLFSPALRHAYASCYVRPGPDASGSLVQLDRRLALKAFLEYRDWSEQDKTALLVRASGTDPVTARTLLLQRLRTHAPALIDAAQRFEVMRLLVQHGQIAEVEEPLWTLLKDSQQSSQRRFEAAALLMSADAEGVIRFLDTLWARYDG